MSYIEKFDIEKIKSDFSNLPDVAAVILHGSYARGKEYVTPTSDIDLIIVLDVDGYRIPHDFFDSLSEISYDGASDLTYDLAIHSLNEVDPRTIITSFNNFDFQYRTFGPNDHVIISDDKNVIDKLKKKEDSWSLLLPKIAEKTSYDVVRLSTCSSQLAFKLLTTRRGNNNYRRELTAFNSENNKLVNEGVLNLKHNPFHAMGAMLSLDRVKLENSSSENIVQEFIRRYPEFSDVEPLTDELLNHEWIDPNKIPQTLAYMNDATILVQKIVEYLNGTLVEHLD